MTLLGYERGEAAATMPMRFRAEVDRLMELARERGLDRRPVDPPAARLVLHEGRDHAVERAARAHPVPRRPASRPGRVDLEAVLERVPQADHRARRRHPRCRGAGADRSRAVAARSRPTTPARRTPRNSWVQTFLPPAPGRSTRARARCSATSSARWCSACRRSREPTPARGPSCSRTGSASAGVISAVCGALASGRRRCASGRGSRREAGGAGLRSCPSPIGLHGLPDADAVRRPSSPTRDGGPDLVSHVVPGVAGCHLVNPGPARRRSR